MIRLFVSRNNGITYEPILESADRDILLSRVAILNSEEEGILWYPSSDRGIQFLSKQESETLLMLRRLSKERGKSHGTRP